MGRILKRGGLCNIVIVIILGVDIINSVCDLVLANSLCVTLSFSLSIHLSYIGMIVNVVRIGPGRSTLHKQCAI